MLVECYALALQPVMSGKAQPGKRLGAIALLIRENEKNVGWSAPPGRGRCGPGLTSGHLTLGQGEGRLHDERAASDTHGSRDDVSTIGAAPAARIFFHRVVSRWLDQADCLATNLLPQLVATVGVTKSAIYCKTDQIS